MEAAWVGGPWDGDLIELPSGSLCVRVAVNHPPELWNTECAYGPDFSEMTLPVTQTIKGYRIYWHEP